MKRRMVQDVMTRKVVTVCEDTPFVEIVDAMAEEGISAVPVIDLKRRVIGVVTEADLLHKEEFHGLRAGRGAIFGRAGRRRSMAKAAAVDARGLMSAPAIVVTPAMSIPAAARLLAEHHIRQAPVVREDGRLAGMVTRSDLLRVFLRPDEEIRAEIIREVLIHDLWQDPALVHVRVNDGLVTMTGRVKARSLIPIAIRLAVATEGVVNVVADLAFEQDDTRPAITSRW